MSLTRFTGHAPNWLEVFRVQNSVLFAYDLTQTFSISFVMAALSIITKL